MGRTSGQLRGLVMDAFFFPADRHVKPDLYELGYRCLHEPASRRLDGEIYCAVHNVNDRNTLINDRLLQARENGEVLVVHGPGDVLAWIEAPPFTAELKYAEALLPEGLLTFYRDARKVCATALQARAIANEPPPLVSLFSAEDEELARGERG
jgi:hypothetical protein